MKPRRPTTLLRDRAGVAAVEAALGMSLLLLPLCMGMVDYGLAVADAARLDRALQSAVLYVFSNQTGFTGSGISAAAGAGFGAGSPTPTVTSATTCKCVSSGYSPVSTVTCASTCPSGQTLATYVTITVTASFNLLISIPTMASPLSESVSGTIRTQ